MIVFLYFFRVRALTANLPTGLQNLDPPVVVVVGDSASPDADPLPSTSAAADAEAVESASSPPTATTPPPPTSIVDEEAEAAVIQTTALMNEHYVEARRPIVSAHRILVPLSHNDWVLFLSFFLSFFL